jgi:hypothetical protein
VHHLKASTNAASRLNHHLLRPYCAYLPSLAVQLTRTSMFDRHDDVQVLYASQYLELVVHVTRQSTPQSNLHLVLINRLVTPIGSRTFQLAGPHPQI